MWKAVKKFWLDEEGVTMIEYALIAAVVAVVSIAAWSAVGGSIRDTMEAVDDKFDNATSGV